MILYSSIDLYIPLISNAIIGDKKRVNECLDKLFPEERDELIKACKIIINSQDSGESDNICKTDT